MLLFCFWELPLSNGKFLVYFCRVSCYCDDVLLLFLRTRLLCDYVSIIFSVSVEFVYHFVNSCNSVLPVLLCVFYKILLTEGAVIKQGLTDILLPVRCEWNQDNYEGKFMFTCLHSMFIRHILCLKFINWLRGRWKW